MFALAERFFSTSDQDVTWNYDFMTFAEQYRTNSHKNGGILFPCRKCFMKPGKFLNIYCLEFDKFCIKQNGRRQTSTIFCLESLVYPTILSFWSKFLKTSSIKTYKSYQCRKVILVSTIWYTLAIVPWHIPYKHL